ncbi:hypothetical protein FACS189431_2480 [Alphaproteobacteria bacterium]|nr:hypothetical protein FACS189431_2480 [Alphaproteobacteria bacterium]
MPELTSLNYKQYAPDSYYHIYNRGTNKMDIFLDEQDRDVFLSLLKRYLSSSVAKDSTYRAYKNYRKQIELITFALMPNHFHLLIYQKDDERAITSFMKAVLISYSRYFNRRYQRVGPVFQNRYLAKLITDTEYFKHLSRYIHLNPTNWQRAKDTSLDFYSRNRQADWIHPEKVLDLFPSFDSYLEFLKSYDPKHEEEIYDFELDS